MGRSLARLRWAARPAGWGPGSQHHWLCVRPGGRAGGRPASPVSLQVTPWAQPCRVLPLRWRVRSGGPVLVSPGTSKLGQLDLLGDPAGVTGMPPAGAGGGVLTHTTATPGRGDPHGSPVPLLRVLAGLSLSPSPKQKGFVRESGGPSPPSPALAADSSVAAWTPCSRTSLSPICSGTLAGQPRPFAQRPCPASGPSSAAGSCRTSR